MHYVIPDIHNDYDKFNKMLKKIGFRKENDHLILLGDLFDRADYNPKPLELYYKIQSLEESVSIVRGNHEEMMGHFIYDYLDVPEGRRDGFAYDYNTFSILRRKMTDRDLELFADWMLAFPLQKTMTVNGENYLFAHAMTSSPKQKKDKNFYIWGGYLGFSYLKNGVEDYISVCGHTITDTIRRWVGEENRPKKPEVWVNKKGNVYMMDCGCGMYDRCKLSCLCLETKGIYYVSTN